MFGVESLVLAGDRVEPSSDRRAGLCNAFPALGRLGRLDRLLRGLAAPAGQRHHIVIGRTAHRIAGRIRVVRRPFATRALTQHASQAEEDEHRQRQKDDGVDIEHVWHALDRRDGNRGSVGSRQTGNLHKQISVPVPICKCATALIQRLAPNHRRMSHLQDHRRSQPWRQQG